MECLWKVEVAVIITEASVLLGHCWSKGNKWSWKKYNNDEIKSKIQPRAM